VRYPLRKGSSIREQALRSISQSAFGDDIILGGSWAMSSIFWGGIPTSQTSLLLRIGGNASKLVAVLNSLANANNSRSD